GQASLSAHSESSLQMLLAGPSQRLSSGSTLPMSVPLTRHDGKLEPKPTLTSTGSSFVVARPRSSLPLRPCAATPAASRANLPSPLANNVVAVEVSPMPARSWKVSEWKKLPKVTGSMSSLYCMLTAQPPPTQGLPTNCTVPCACGFLDSSPTSTCAVPSTAHVVRWPNTSAASGENAAHTG